MTYEEEIILARRYQALGRAIVERAIEDYIKYIKASHRNYNAECTKAEIYAFGKDAKRFLSSKTANYYANLDYRINMADTIKKRYKTDEAFVSNVYYRELKKKEKGKDNVRIE